jgi:hypothetical protein
MTSVLLLVLFLAQQAPVPEKCTLSGSVVDSVTGLPLGKVELVAEHPGGWDPSASTTTDARGHFKMVDVDPGEYRLSAKRNGYLDTFYGARKSSTGGSAIILTAGQNMEDLQISLTPFGVIAGTVRDPDGEPLGGAVVQIMTSRFDGGQRRIRQFDGTVTNDLGEYRFANLPSGKYYVFAGFEHGDNAKARVVDRSVRSSEPREVAITTYYPGTADPSAAGLIEVTTGARVTGRDITLIRSPVYKVAVHVDSPAGFKATASLRSAVEGLGGLGDLRWVNAAGDMEIDGVPPGRYRIQIGTLGSDKSSRVPDGLTVLCETSVPLSVDRSDVTGVRLAASGCAEVRGRVTVEGGELKLAGRTAVRFGTGEFDDRADVESDGSFEAVLSPGHHSVDLVPATGDNGLYLKSVRSGNQDVLRDGLTLSGSEHAELALALAPGGGRIEGVALDADDKPVLGAAVVLIPNEPALRPRLNFARDAVTDKSGHFELKGVAPGEYRLFAWNDIEKDSWFDPDVLKDYEAKGEPVTVKVSDSQTVKLHVIH